MDRLFGSVVTPPPPPNGNLVEIHEVTMREMISLPKEDDACQDEGVEFKQCLAGYVSRRINCTAPWETREEGDVECRMY